MNCEHIENLLPAYAEGDLAGQDEAKVSAHLRDCHTCRESLAFFVELERSLARRRAIRPSPHGASLRVARHLGLRPRRRFLPELAAVPVAVSTVLIVLGVVLLLLRRSTQEFIAQTGTDGARLLEDFETTLSVLLQGVALALDTVASVDAWILAIVYFGVLALTLFSGSWIVLRYVRD